ncbi:SMP-30/gluconolactonase/LRE family protein [Geminicoccus harenae]|uniref:SMP-30/gluconolactonase/LRE family protein n=2 Tax=Geminicoccus harenae TaxID=2498453 RepID=UPI001C965689|nr:SMP-30/gluconolactonase/LRE family protein [Geminicoccus harenae]
MLSAAAGPAAALPDGPASGRMAAICGDCRVERFTQCGAQLKGPAFDEAGNLWMVSGRTGDIHKVTPDGRCTTVANSGGVPAALKFHQDGRLFGADLARGIFVLDLATGAISDYATEFGDKGFAGPYDLVFDALGGLYFTDAGTGRVRSSLLSPTGAVYHVSPEPAKKVRRLAGGLAFPSGLALDAAGRSLLVSESSAKRIFSIRLQSGPEAPLISSVVVQLQGKPTADGMAFDVEGNLYVAHAGAGEVLVLDADQLPVGAIALPAGAGQSPTGLAYHGGHLYVTEADENEVWRVRVTNPLVDHQKGADAGELVMADPIPGKITRSGIAVELDTVLTAPPTAKVTRNFPRAALVQLADAGDGSGKLYLADQNGVIWLIRNGVLAAEPFLDLREVRGPALITGGHQVGLRSFAFHPDFGRKGTPGHGRLYTATTESTISATGAVRLFEGPGSAALHDVLTEWRVDPGDADRVDPASRREILRAEQPARIHTIDLIAFNPAARPGEADYGKLYLGFGDGAYREGVPDPLRQAQDPSTPLGSILRIDPLASGDDAYRVPDDNPFLGRPGYLPETWAFGFKNPERFSWDSVTGKMLISDIGQEYVEEINLGLPGGNYGFGLREGTFALDPKDARRLSMLPADDAANGFIYPVAQYDHDEGDAVMGGFVYRGRAIPELQGQYVFGDLVRGRVFHVPVGELVQGRQAGIRELTLLDEGRETTLRQLVGNQQRVDLRFGTDGEGELYLLTKQDGAVRAVRPAGAGTARAKGLAEPGADGQLRR